MARIHREGQKKQCVSSSPRSPKVHLISLSHRSSTASSLLARWTRRSSSARSRSLGSVDRSWCVRASFSSFASGSHRVLVESSQDTEAESSGAKGDAFTLDDVSSPSSLALPFANSLRSSRASSSSTPASHAKLTTSSAAAATSMSRSSRCLPRENSTLIRRRRMIPRPETRRCGASCRLPRCATRVQSRYVLPLPSPLSLTPLAEHERPPQPLRPQRMAPPQLRRRSCCRRHRGRGASCARVYAGGRCAGEGRVRAAWWGSEAEGRTDRVCVREEELGSGRVGMRGCR